MGKRIPKREDDKYFDNRPCSATGCRDGYVGGYKCRKCRGFGYIRVQKKK